MVERGDRRLTGEAAKQGPGNRAVLARLSELLFMEILRWQLTYVSHGHRGWLAGLNDPHVGRTLGLLHAEPARPWTVEELAQRAAVRGQRSPNDLSNWLAKRRCNISRAGGCTLRAGNCVTARLRLPRLPRASAMIPRPLLAVPFAGSWAFHLRAGAKPTPHRPNQGR
jgi:hypothetical protein